MLQGKKAYDSIEIPEELSDRVNQAIASVDRETAVKHASAQRRQRRMLTGVKSFGTLAAALLICVTVGLNTSQVFAQNLGSLPVVGGFFQVLTVRSYEKTEGDVNFNVNVPQIAIAPGEQQESGSADQSVAQITADEVNTRIQKIVDAYMQQCRQNMEEYKDAFFATGGTEAEWADRKMDVYVSYEVKYQEGTILSMVLTTEQAWFSAYSQNLYYNVDLESGKVLTVEDMLGSNWVSMVNESIDRQIQERMAADPEMNRYWGYGPTADEFEEKFETVTKDTSFYINSEGKVVICFPKYEIAPGYMGVQEFVIE